MATAPSFEETPSLEAHCPTQDTEKDLPLPSSHDNTGTAVQVDNLPAAIQNGFGALTQQQQQQFTANLAEINGRSAELMKMTSRLTETELPEADLHLIDTEIESLGAELESLSAQCKSFEAQVTAYMRTRGCSQCGSKLWLTESK